MLNFNKKKYVSFDNLKSFNGLLQSSLKEKLDGYKSETDTKVQKKFNELSGKVQTDSEVIDARKGEASLRAKIDVIDDGIKNVSSQLEHIAIYADDFGAVGDGVNDDTNAIQGALDYLNTRNGGTLYIKDGKYKITKQLKIHSNTTLKMSKNCILYNYIIHGSTSVLSNFSNDDSYSSYNGCGDIVISGGKIVCIPSNEHIELFRSFEDWGNQAIALSHAKNIIVDGVYIQDVYRAHGIELTGCNDITIKNCIFDGWMSDERYDQNKIREAIQIEASISGANANPYYDNTVCDNIKIYNNTVKKIRSFYEDYGVGIGSHSNRDNSINIKIKDNYIDGCQYAGVTYGKWTNSEIVNNTIINCENGVTSYVETTLNNVLIKNNKIENVNNIGLFLKKGCNNVLISSNTVKECGSNGFYIDEASINLTINDNVFINCNNLLKSNAYAKFYGLKNSSIFNNRAIKTNDVNVDIGIQFNENSNNPFENTAQYNNVVGFECDRFDITLPTSLINNENLISNNKSVILNNTQITSKVNPLKFKNIILDINMSGVKRVICPVTTSSYDVSFTNVASGSNGLAVVKMTISISNGVIKITNPRMTTINESIQSTIDITSTNNYTIDKIVGLY